MFYEIRPRADTSGGAHAGRLACVVHGGRVVTAVRAAGHVGAVQELKAFDHHARPWPAESTMALASELSSKHFTVSAGPQKARTAPKSRKTGGGTRNSPEESALWASQRSQVANASVIFSGFPEWKTMAGWGRFRLSPEWKWPLASATKTDFHPFPEEKHSATSNEKTTDQREEIIVSLGNKIFLQ